MKKIWKLLLAVLLVTGIAGCSGKKITDEAIEAYITASMNALKMKDADYTINMEMTDGENEAKIKMYGAYDANSNLQLSMKMDMSMQNQTMNVMEGYVKDSVLYADAMGEKAAVSFASLKPFLDIALENPTTTEPDPEEVKKILNSAELKDGHLLMEMNADKVEETMKEAEKESGTSVSDTSDVKVSDIKMDITLEDDFMTNMILDFTVENETSGVINAHLTIGFTNINQGHTIAFPDLSAYPEAEDILDAM